jgi:hypothetical protein
MLVPGENRVTQQYSCFPLGCGHGDFSGFHRTLTNRRWTQFVQLECLVRNADPSRLWRGLEQTAYIVKARQAWSGVVCGSDETMRCDDKAIRYLTALQQ